MFAWIISIASILGAILNARGKRIGWVIWLITNLSWSIYCLVKGFYAQIPMWLFYAAVCVYGLWNWKRMRFGTKEK